MSRFPSEFATMNGGGGWGDRTQASSEPHQHNQRRMNIDRDDAEAGSILISLAGHRQERPAAERKRSMSIQSLLGTTEQQQRSPSLHELNNINYEFSTNEHRRDDILARGSGRPSSKENGNNSNLGYQPMNMLERMLHSPPASKQHLIMKSSQCEPMTDLENYEDSQKQNPKIRRNALHAYISYMIYTDLTNQQKPFDVKPVPPKETAGFAVVMNNNSDRPGYPFSAMAFQKMNSMLSDGFRRAEASRLPHHTLPTSGSAPLLAGQRDNWNANSNQAQEGPNNNIIHRPLTAYLRSTWPEARETPPGSSPEGFKSRPYASVPLSPGIPPNHGRMF
ncbi:hypothetical protein BJV82DRAFT_600959 [Fennellomyces sp. T-0311]|nr:hypothetical protein BJV82DRAFT_600959 [Fennellomyces sp. T-0311]